MAIVADVHADRGDIPLITDIMLASELGFKRRCLYSHHNDLYGRHSKLGDLVKKYMQ